MDVDGDEPQPSGSSQETAMPLMRANTLQVTKYQQLYNKVKEFVDETERDNFCLNDICDAVEESDSLLQPSNEEWVHVDPRLVLLDAKILNNASKAYKMTAEALVVDDHKFDTVDFVDNIRRRVDGWSELEEFVDKCFLPVPPRLSFMYGGLTFDPGNRKTLQLKSKRTVGVVADAVKPTKVITFDEEDAGIQAVLEHMTRVLVRTYHARGDEPVLYFKFVLDPRSFARTVQNLFHVAFLVRDGLATLHEDRRGLPVLVPITKTRKRANSGKVNQLVSSITVPQWEKLVETFRIRESPLVSSEEAGQ